MEEKQNSRNVSIVKDLNGNNIVIINDIIFKGIFYGIHSGDGR